MAQSHDGRRREIACQCRSAWLTATGGVAANIISKVDTLVLDDCVRYIRFKLARMERIIWLDLIKENELFLEKTAVLIFIEI